MKKWMIFIFLFVVITVGFFVSVYLSAVEPVKAGEKKAAVIAKQEANLTKTTDFYLYNGDETYYVIKGENGKGSKMIVWIPEKKGPIVTKKEKDGITKQDAIRKINQEKNPKKIIAVRLGMLKKIPSWEIYYLSENNLINYYYVDFETGEWLKTIENL